MSLVYLAIIAAYDVGGATTTTLYYSSGLGFVSAPGDTPANTFFDPRLTQPVNIRRDMFAPGTTRGPSKVSRGTLVLNNGDGGLDTLQDHAFDGRAITVYRGEDTAAFPGGFTVIWKGTMQDADLNENQLTIRLRDNQEDLDQPFQPTKYAGDNVLPAGLEGVTDLEGKPKPITLGVVRNVPAVLVNSSKLIYQVNDGAVDSIDQVYDSGIQLIRSPWDWTLRTTPTTDQINGLAYDPDDNSRWVAVGNNGQAWTSDDDGETWTSRTSSFGSTVINDVVWCDALSLFVAVGASGKIATSPAGITWTQRTNTFTSTIYSVAWDGVTVVAGGAGAGGGEIETSTNGTAWTSRTPGGTATIFALAWGRNQFVSGRASGEIWTSPDGTTWTQTTDHRVTTAIEGIAFGAGRFVLSANAATQVAYSEDGLSWTNGVNFANTTNASFNDIAFSELLGLFVMVGSDGDYNNIVASSIFGDTWTVHKTTFGALAPFAVGANASNVLVAGAGGALITTPPAADFGSEANLLDDDLQPPPGQAKPYAAGGYFRLGSSPVGEVTADVTEGASAAVRTAGQLWVDALELAGKTTGDWSASDVTALDSANATVCGFWSGLNEMTFSAVLSKFAESPGAWWGVDHDGVYRIRVLTDPTGETAAITIIDTDMTTRLRRVPAALPTYKTIVSYQPNYTIQSTGLAAGVSDSRRGVLGKAALESEAVDATVQTKFLLAREQDVSTLMNTKAGADTEASRLQTLRGVRRDRYAFSIPLDSETDDVDIGTYLEVIHPRFELSGGKTFVVMKVHPDANKETVALEVWG